MKANKRDTLDRLMTPDQKEAIRELRDAVIRFYKDSSPKVYEQVLVAFFTAVRDGKAAYCPAESFDSAAGTFEPGKVKTSDGMMYVLCTSPEEAALCPEDSVVVIGMDHIVGTAAEDQKCNGVCLNPYGVRPCVLPRDVIKRMINIG